MFDLNDMHDKATLTGLIRTDIERYAKQFDDGHRTHLGASLIGGKCDRYLWYVFRWAFTAPFDARMQLLWQRGHREEIWLWEMLRYAGWTIYELDPTTGKQWRCSAVGGHFGGSLDAIGFPPPGYPLQEWVLIECKTKKNGDSSAVWNRLEKQGLQLEEPKHYAQQSTYGHLFRDPLFLSMQPAGLRYSIYFSTNKDDDRKYIEPTILDMSLGERMVNKAQFIILSNNPPPKIHENLSHFDCKYCDAREVCHKGATMDRNCRSCKFVKPGDEKTWFCTGYQRVLDQATTEVGCANWQQVA